MGETIRAKSFHGETDKPNVARKDAVAAHESGSAVTM
jgi:hypothetical protein